MSGMRSDYRIIGRLEGALAGDALVTQAVHSERMSPSFIPTEEQELLRETARRFLEQKCPPSSVRALMESDEGFDPSIWKEIADLGWQGIAIPEAYGGAGSTMLEQAVLMEEMGKVLFPGPYLASAVLAANTIMLAGNEEQKRDLLPEIASGERIVTVAFAKRALSKANDQRGNTTGYGT